MVAACVLARCWPAARSRSSWACSRAGAAHAQDAVKVLVFHGPPDRDDRRGRRRDRGASARRTASTSTPRRRRAAHRGQPRGLPRGRVPQHRGQPDLSTRAGGRGRGVRRGRRRLPRHRQRPRRPSPASPFFDQLIGARPRPGSPTGATAQTVAAGDRVHPVHARPPARRGTAPTPGTSGRRGRPARSTRSRATTRRRRPPATAPTSAAPTTRSPGAATSEKRPLLLHRHGPHGRQLRRGRLPGPPARRDPVGRRPVRGNCKATINATTAASASSAAAP